MATGEGKAAKGEPLTGFALGKTVSLSARRIVERAVLFPKKVREGKAFP
jgi:hypothetical protein